MNHKKLKLYLALCARSGYGYWQAAAEKCKYYFAYNILPWKFPSFTHRVVGLNIFRSCIAEIGSERKISSKRNRREIMQHLNLNNITNTLEINALVQRGEGAIKRIHFNENLFQSIFLILLALRKQNH